MTILNRGLIKRGLLRRGLIGGDSPTTSGVFLDDWSQLFTSSELFADAELWSLPPVPTGLLFDTVLEFDTSLIGDI